MRNGQKRMRGRNNNHRKSQNPLTRVYESNGPDVKIRGTASHVAEKYMQLARDSQSSGDPVAAENYFQHAEHYFRLIALANEQFRQQNPYYNNQQQPQQGQQGAPQGAADDNFDDGDDDGQPFVGQNEPNYAQQQQPTQQQPQPYLPREAQPYPPRDQQQQHNNRPQQNYQQPSPGNEAAPDVGGLPSFITGGGQPQPQQQSNPNQNSQNGHDQGGNNQGGNNQDRFGHRRRRRHRGGGYRPDRPDFGNNNPQGAQQPPMPNDGGDEPPR
jgi:hypothetical protein